MVATLFEKEIAPVRPPAQSVNHRLAGIDPGFEGAIVVVSPNAPPLKFALPVIEIPSKDKKKGPKHFYDIPMIKRFLRENADFVYLEQQQAQSKPVPRRCKTCGDIVDVATPQGITSTFTTGRGFGVLEGLVAGLEIPYKLVHPLTWQARMLPAGHGDTKGRAKLACGALYPKLDLRQNERCRKPHAGICDALLIATFGQREMMWTAAEDPELGF